MNIRFYLCWVHSLTAEQGSHTERTRLNNATDGQLNKSNDNFQSWGLATLLTSSGLSEFGAQLTRGGKAPSLVSLQRNHGTQNFPFTV